MRLARRCDAAPEQTLLPSRVESPISAVPVTSGVSGPSKLRGFIWHITTGEYTPECLLSGGSILHQDEGFDRSQRSDRSRHESEEQRRNRSQSPNGDRGSTRSRDGTGSRGLLSRFSGRSGAQKRVGRNRSENNPDLSKRVAPTYQPGGQTNDQDNRAPSATDWRATDFASRELRAWDEFDQPPFELPPNQDARDEPQQRHPMRAASRTRRLEDDYEDAGWETGTWDTRWSRSVDYRENASRGQQYDLASELRADTYEDYDYADYDALEYSLDTLARLGAVGESLGRVARVRLLVRRRPAAAALLTLFLLGFMLTCFAPLIPILRLGYDAVDISRRVTTLRGIVTDSSALFNATKLKEAQGEIDGITRDLYEINGAMNVAGAPLAAVNPEMRNYRLLVRIGYDVAASADEGINVVQTLLAPLQGGALSAGNSPGITTSDMQQAKAVLADARTRMQDALAAYNSLDPQHMPSQLQPGSKYDKLLGLLPTANSALQELSAMLNFMPQLLGVGQPAAYLVVAMDRTELRAGGGFTGNFGYLVLDGGKESKTYPLSLHDVYQLDQDYYQKNTANQADCASSGPQPPLIYWWWPYRDLPGCLYGWGLRDSNLSPNFPTNAAMALQIAQASGNVPTTVQTQGMIAITPTVIEEVLQAIAPKGLYLKDYNRTVTAQNLEHTIHEFQLGSKQPQNQQRKEFTHVLSSVMLDKIKSLHGSALKPVLAVLEKAIKEKDVQIYFSNPQAELVLEQLGLASTVYHGNSDGFFVVDTNDGGNKANQYVSEHQTDVVTLLPNGGALHHLQISVTYDKKGSVYQGTTNFEDYLDMQRTYLPGNATILGYSGFTPDVFGFSQCVGMFASAITDCVSPVHAITGVTTESDVAGRTMVMGSVLVQCGPYENYQSDYYACDTNPTPHTVNTYIEWYTPNAFKMDTSGHGTYTELIEKQAGSADFLLGVGDYLTVYVDTSQLHAKSPATGQDTLVTSDSQFAALIKDLQPVINHEKLLTDTHVTFHF